MFQCSVVNDAELAAYKQRTIRALDAEKPVDVKTRAIIRAFSEWPNIATVWAFTGEVRKDGDKLRTRRHHSLTFVATVAGLKDINHLLEGWQPHEYGKRFQLNFTWLRQEGNANLCYPSWTFRLNYRPDPDVVESVMEHWLALAIFTEHNH
ncbi:hypothetical protein FU280_12875 [Salmonella enterica subsp. enterica]|nr:hypothetical protein [Salmonella enterica subsp. enterica serovar Muenchen]WNT47925.1 hypothetical protein SPLA3_PHROGS00120 [Salmonella phage SPLA3]